MALDERTGHSDLESDKQTLEKARQLAALSPEQLAALQQTAATTAETDNNHDLDAALQARLAQLPPEQRAAAEAQIRAAWARFAAMSPEAQQAAMAQAEQEQIATLTHQARAAVPAARRGEQPADPLAQNLDEVAQRILHDWGTETGPRAAAWQDLAAFLHALTALLRNTPPPPVPTAYAGQWALVVSA